MTHVNLIIGTLDTNSDMDGWIITSKAAIVEGAEDLPLKQGDTIDTDSNVRRDGDVIGNID